MYNSACLLGTESTGAVGESSGPEQEEDSALLLTGRSAHMARGGQESQIRLVKLTQNLTH